VILVDSNTRMHLVGAPRPLKADAQRLRERCIAERERLVTVTVYPPKAAEAKVVYPMPTWEEREKKKEGG
jgi:hypothetical protein